LEKFKEQLAPKPSDWPNNKPWPGRKPGSYKWFEIQDNVAYWQEFEKPKILLRSIMDTPTFAYEEVGLYHNDTLYMLPDAEKFITTILNSFLCWWFLCKTCPDLQGGFLKAQKEKLFQIPILSLSPSDKKTLENAAEKFAKSDIPITKTYKLEQEINTLVAHLYGLTLSEYTLILNDLKLSDEVRSACLEEFRGIAKNGAAGG
jgi:hypothetical protein